MRLIALLTLLALASCQGYPRYSPESCSAVDFGDGAPLWTCS